MKTRMFIILIIIITSIMVVNLFLSLVNCNLFGSSTVSSNYSETNYTKADQVRIKIVKKIIPYLNNNEVNEVKKIIDKEYKFRLRFITAIIFKNISNEIIYARYIFEKQEKINIYDDLNIEKSLNKYSCIKGLLESESKIYGSLIIYFIDE